MIELTETSVSRCGITARYFDIESTNVQAFTSDNSSRFHLQFDIASKGGGRTLLQLNIGATDWARILPMLAEKYPRELAAAFADSTATAVGKVCST